jgi:polyisoprenoid-binding protein YceI
MTLSGLRPVLAFAFFLALSGASVGAHAETPADMPAGIYKLDPKHTCVLFRISHLGFSHFTGRFDTVEGTLGYNSATPDQLSLDVTIYPNAIDTNDSDLDEDLRTVNWFDVIKYPQATFHATQVERTGDNTAKITGDFTLRGVTHTLVLDTVLVGAGTDAFNGGAKVMGFSATGSFARSDYGMNNLQPFVGDEVSLQIDSEFDKDDADRHE